MKCIIIGCNCDGREVATDSAVMYGPFVPITNIFAIHSPNDVRGEVTLGPLICFGSGKILILNENFFVKSSLLISSWSFT